MTVSDASSVRRRRGTAVALAVLATLFPAWGVAQGRAVVRLAPNAAQYLSHLGVPFPAPPAI